MSTRMPVLVDIITSERYTLTGQSTTVGRHPDCNIVIETDEYCSANHARIFWDQGAWMVEDLGSSNGTTVNDLPISQPTKLSPGDVMKFGRTRFRIE